MKQFFDPCLFRACCVSWWDQLIGQESIQILLLRQEIYIKIFNVKTFYPCKKYLCPSYLYSKYCAGVAV